jgi:hypothetical protein
MFASGDNFPGGFAPSAAHVLIMVRDKKSISLDELNSYFIDPPVSPSAGPRFNYKLITILQSLSDAGLIVESDGRYQPSPQLSKIQGALDLSLTELANRGQNTMTIIPLFGKPDLSGTKADIFVLMPFSTELKPIYATHIKKVAQDLNLSVARADDFFNTHEIIQDVWQGIATSRLLIADCTGKNPNVFYEIGMAHSIGKPVILISQTLEDIPFDLRHRRVIVYKYTPPGMMEFEEQLTATITSTLGI